VERDVILERLRERIVAFAASRLSRDVAEDVAQEVLILLEEKYPQVARLEELIPLSLQIVRFKTAALRRKAQRRGEHTRLRVDEMQVPDLSEDPAAAVERRERMDRLAAAISRLGERCRDLMRLKLEGRSFAEIQRHFGVDSINTVYTWDFRCRRQLLDLMGGSWEAEENREVGR
jgi:RNA polymerase sigma-70 factor (ECF subfamily)